jgi:hypothetical protein
MPTRAKRGLGAHAVSLGRRAAPPEWRTVLAHKLKELAQGILSLRRAPCVRLECRSECRRQPTRSAGAA